MYYGNIVIYIAANGYIENQELDSFVKQLFDCMPKDSQDLVIAVTILLYLTILYYTILYYTILYYIILYFTILYYTLLYYTILFLVGSIILLLLYSIGGSSF